LARGVLKELASGVQAQDDEARDVQKELANGERAQDDEARDVLKERDDEVGHDGELDEDDGGHVGGEDQVLFLDEYMG
jgi:hypothetical protein